MKKVERIERIRGKVKSMKKKKKRKKKKKEKTTLGLVFQRHSGKKTNEKSLTFNECFQFIR